MKFLLWSMLRKNNEGEVIKSFEPKHLDFIAKAVEKYKVDAFLLYEVPFMPSDNKWNYLRESLHGGHGWCGFHRAAYHYDWGIIYLSKSEIKRIECVRFDDTEDYKGFDFLDVSGRTSITIHHEESESLAPSVTFFQAKPRQNSALRCETVESILSSITDSSPHILAGNLIDNERDGQLFQEVLYKRGYRVGFEELTMPAKAPMYQADCIFIKDLDVKRVTTDLDLLQGSTVEHKPILVELA